MDAQEELEYRLKTLQANRTPLLIAQQYLPGTDLISPNSRALLARCDMALYSHKMMFGILDQTATTLLNEKPPLVLRKERGGFGPSEIRSDEFVVPLEEGYALESPESGIWRPEKSMTILRGLLRPLAEKTQNYILFTPRRTPPATTIKGVYFAVGKDEIQQYLLQRLEDETLSEDIVLPGLLKLEQLVRQ